MFSQMKKKIGLAAAGIGSSVSYAWAGVGADAATKVGEASTEAELVYVAVIAAFAGYFVVRLILKAL